MTALYRLTCINAYCLAVLFILNLRIYIYKLIQLKTDAFLGKVYRYQVVCANEHEP